MDQTYRQVCIKLRGLKQKMAGFDGRWGGGFEEAERGGCAMATAEARSAVSCHPEIYREGHICNHLRYFLSVHKKRNRARIRVGLYCNE